MGHSQYDPDQDRSAWNSGRKLGAKLDERANASGATTISTGTSSILIESRSTQQELMIARHVLKFVHK